MDTFRKEYAPLSDEQKADMLAIKLKADELEALFDKARKYNPRLIAIAMTDLEKTILVAIKAVTTEQKVG